MFTWYLYVKTEWFEKHESNTFGEEKNDSEGKKSQYKPTLLIMNELTKSLKEEDIQWHDLFIHTLSSQLNDSLSSKLSPLSVLYAQVSIIIT